MPAAANSKLFDTVENRIATKLQRGVSPILLTGRARTSGAVQTGLLFDQTSQPKADGSGGGRIKIPDGTVVHYVVYVVAANITDDPGTNLNYGQAFELKGVVTNRAGTIAFPTTNQSTANGFWDEVAYDATASHVIPAANIVAQVNQTDDCLELLVTGVAAKDIVWRASAILTSVSIFS